MLKNKVAIVTGGSKGIGLAISQTLAKEGVKVVIADIDEKNGASVAKKIGGHFVLCNISDENEVRALVEEVGKRYSVLHMLINTAKVYLYKNMRHVTTQQWMSSTNVNINGFFFLAKHCLPLLEQTNGVVVEVGCGLGAPLENESAPYSASEAASYALVKNIARSHAGKVRALMVNPGPIDTPLLHVAFKGDVEKYGRLNPSKRIGSPKEVAELVKFLVGDDASFITGSMHHVDGGEKNL